MKMGAWDIKYPMRFIYLLFPRARLLLLKSQAGLILHVYAEKARKDPAIELLYECNYFQNSWSKFWNLEVFQSQLDSSWDNDISWKDFSKNVAMGSMVAKMW